MNTWISMLLAFFLLFSVPAYAQRESAKFKPFTCNVTKELKGDPVVIRSITVDKPFSTIVTITNGQTVTFDDWTPGALGYWERAGKREDGAVFIWNAVFYPSQSSGSLTQVHIEGKRITVNSSFKLSCSYDLF